MKTFITKIKPFFYLQIIALCSLFYINIAYAVRDPSMVIDIDNPGFRRIVAAVPFINVEGSIESKFLDLPKKGTEDLSALLTFSGMFQIMPQDTFKDLSKLAPKDPKALLSSIAGFEKIDTLQWKALGVESLTIGKLIQEKDGLRLEYRSADLVKGAFLVGKSYFIKDESDLIAANKRYADHLLQAYTGKPGIFSTKITFVGRKTAQSEKQIYICDIDGKNVEQITHTQAIHLSPSWSPDGKKLLYTSYESGNPDLYMIDLTTRKKNKISGHKGINSGGAYSANGQLIAFTGTIREGEAEIFTMNPPSGIRAPLMEGNGIAVDPNFSPDGKWLAFVSGRFGNPHIFRGKLEWSENNTKVRIVEDLRLTYAGWYNATPAWSPDSRKIAFAGFDKEINRFDLFMMNPDGTNLERLTLKSGDNENPTWSPNGQLIMFDSNRVGSSDQKGNSRLYIMNKDGSDQKVIETGLYESSTPRWGPLPAAGL